ncbi:phytochrome A-associated F-box protein [Argentina anserina]|uniref:phytochrome A-associated F-box protein n=1 Tax=Argentina anserina TaxID=57926 RepID=UPI0021763F83|nr:phytochrome A-associated F-box protein [Potentilla anserina]
MFFSRLPDDVVLNIFHKLEDDPRHWARLACACTKFSSLVRNVCCKSKCRTSLPSVVSSCSADEPPGGWSSLHKLAVCCPGLLHSGILLDNSDFGLERELGPDHQSQSQSSSAAQITHEQQPLPPSDCAWSLYDDLYFDTVYDDSEAATTAAAPAENTTAGVSVVGEFPISKRRKICRSMRSHLASGAWNLSREPGNKLLHSRFRGDCLYICDWPGCIHVEDRRSYMLFRGFFKDFKGSQVWRNIKDGKRTQVELSCAYCTCKHTWDLHSAFCLRRGFGYHDDGDPVVRAYVCDNGHVSGAWTDLPLYA